MVKIHHVVAKASFPFFSIQMLMKIALTDLRTGDLTSWKYMLALPNKMLLSVTHYHIEKSVADGHCEVIATCP